MPGALLCVHDLLLFPEELHTLCNTPEMGLDTGTRSWYHGAMKDILLILVILLVSGAQAALVAWAERG
jgi:hypothetical protein